MTHHLPAAVAVLIPLLALAQPPKSFEVASIHLLDPNTPRLPGGGLPPKLQGGRLQYTGTVHSMIERAYSLPGCDNCDFVIGGPTWIRQDAYRIEAKLPEGAPQYNSSEFELGEADAVYQMIQSLLAERFHLKMHRETKEVAAYTLTVEPPGHKLTPTAGKMMQYSDGTTRLDRRLGIIPFQSPGGIPMLRMTVTGFTVQDLGDAMSGWYDRPVLDRTGLKGRFDFTMEYETGSADPRPVLGSPELVAALRKQLGLRLEPKKASVEVVVIDSIARPTEN